MIYMKENMNEYRSYIIKKLINKSVQIICRKLQIKYLICWLDYNLKYDIWYSIENLQNMQKLNWAASENFKMLRQTVKKSDKSSSRIHRIFQRKNWLEAEFISHSIENFYWNHKFSSVFLIKLPKLNHNSLLCWKTRSENRSMQWQMYRKFR